jgi:hypothetical protein
MGDKFLGGVAQRSVAEENHGVKAFFFYGSNESFEMRRQIQGPGREANATGANLLNHVAKRLAVLGVSVHEQVALVAQESIQRVGEVAADLASSRLRWDGWCSRPTAHGEWPAPAGQDQEQQLPRLQNKLHISPDVA